MSKKPKKQRFQKRMMNPVECLKTSSKSMPHPQKKMSLDLMTWRLQVFVEKNVSVNLEVAGDRVEGVKEPVESEEMESATADSTFKSVFIKKRSEIVMRV